MLADDHALVRDAIGQMLERLDDSLEIVGVKNFDEVLLLLSREQEISLLLLDYRMPGMHGVASVSKIKSLYPDLPVGIISGLLAPEDVEPLIAAGAIGVFPKTMSGPALLMALKLSLSGQIYVPWSGDLNPMPPVNEAIAVAATTLPELTTRQREVLGLVVGGGANKEIAQRLGLSEVTVKIHVAALCRKFGVSNRTQLATSAIRAGVTETRA